MRMKRLGFALLVLLLMGTMLLALVACDSDDAEEVDAGDATTVEDTDTDSAVVVD